ncbi:helix-turn-helix domain-containing protein [Termitidicoccus mucosus]
MRGSLKTGSYTVNQVAYMTGFSDHSHLTAQFKRQFGVPPRAYLPRIRTV